MQTLTIANLKGGTGKTTTAAYLAHAFAEQGRSVLVVDADPQGSALRWSEVGQWEIPTLGLAVTDLHTRLGGIVPAGIDLVIVDTPPLQQEHHRGIVYSALRAADTVVVPLAPTMLEFERLPEVWEAIETVSPLRAVPPNAVVLFNRTITNATSTEAYPELLSQQGHRVLSVSIPRRESIAQAGQAELTDLGAYRYAAEELSDLTGVA